MAKYLGKDLVFEFGSDDLSGQYTEVTITEDAPEAEQVDVSDKSSTEQETIEGLPKAPKTTVTLNANDVAGGASAILGLTLNDQETGVLYPEGKTQGKPMRTVTNLRLSNREMTGGYQSKVGWKLSFYSYEAVTDSTYSTT